MGEKKVPRRMQRFYRQGKEPQGDEYDYTNGEDYPKNLPSMGYEDLEKNISEENKREIQTLEAVDLEQKLALFEVEKFKKKNKRLPNKEESQQIADNLYTQFKESEDLSGEKPEKRGRRKRNRDKMPPSKRKRIEREDAMNEQTAEDEAIMPKRNIKDLFGSAGTTENIEDEFKLDLGGEEKKGEELEELGELENEDAFNLDSMDTEQICPTCNKKTDKIIYCSKCGTAFCNNCGKGKCPKCGTVVKS